MIPGPQEVTRMAAPTLVVDADGHVLEHPDGMLRFAPAEYRERIWHIETKADGSEWLHYNGGVRPAGGMALAGTAGMTAAGRERARGGKLPHSGGPARALSPAPRPPHMPGEGITPAGPHPALPPRLPAGADGGLP